MAHSLEGVLEPFWLLQTFCGQLWTNIASPMTRLTKKNALKWSDEASTAFQQLEHMFPYWPCKGEIPKQKQPRPYLNLISNYVRTNKKVGTKSKTPLFWH